MPGNAMAGPGAPDKVIGAFAAASARPFAGNRQRRSQPWKLSLACAAPNGHYRLLPTQQRSQALAVPFYPTMFPFVIFPLPGVPGELRFHRLQP